VAKVMKIKNKAKIYIILIVKQLFNLEKSVEHGIIA